MGKQFTHWFSSWSNLVACQWKKKLLRCFLIGQNTGRREFVFLNALYKMNLCSFSQYFNLFSDCITIILPLHSMLSYIFKSWNIFGKGKSSFFSRLLHLEIRITCWSLAFSRLGKLFVHRTIECIHFQWKEVYWTFKNINVNNWYFRSTYMHRHVCVLFCFYLFFEASLGLISHKVRWVVSDKKDLS